MVHGEAMFVKNEPIIPDAQAAKAALVVAAGIHAKTCCAAMSIVRRIYVEKDGSLAIWLMPRLGQSRAEDRTLVEQALIAWQAIGGQRTPVAAAYAIATHAASASRSARTTRRSR